MFCFSCCGSVCSYNTGLRCNGNWLLNEHIRRNHDFWNEESLIGMRIVIKSLLSLVANELSLMMLWKPHKMSLWITMYCLSLSHLIISNIVIACNHLLMLAIIRDHEQYYATTALSGQCVGLVPVPHIYEYIYIYMYMKPKICHHCCYQFPRIYHC